MKRAGKTLRNAAAAAGVILQFAFLFASAAPRAVLCHRPGGETVLEFELVPGECRCDECAQCRERGQSKQAGIPMIRASHCVHNEIDSEAGRTLASFRGFSKAFPSGPPPPAAFIAGIPDPPVPPKASPPRGRDEGAGPPGTAALRC